MSKIFAKDVCAVQNPGSPGSLKKKRARKTKWCAVVLAYFVGCGMGLIFLFALGRIVCDNKVVSLSSYVTMCECKASTWDDGVIMRVSHDCCCSWITFRCVVVLCCYVYLVTPTIV